MPVDTISHNNVIDTYDKNKGNLADAIRFGGAYQSMLVLNDRADEYDDYEADERKALGFGEGLVEQMPKQIRQDLAVTYMPDRSLKSYKNAMLEVLKAENRFALEDDALYRQTLDALPENEPFREEKANYLHKRGLQDEGLPLFLQDMKGTLSARLMESVDDILDGETHDGNVRDATIGEVLDRFGYDNAGKDEFIRKYGYDSLDQTLYDRQVKNEPKLKDEPDSRIRDAIHAALRGCMEAEATAECSDKLWNDMDPDERKRISDREERQKLFHTDGRELSPNIASWVEEKGAHIGDELYKVHAAASMQKNRLIAESNRSLKYISANAPSQTVLDRQADETAYISQIVKGEKTSSELLDGIISEGKEKLGAVELKTAEEFINQIRRSFKNKEFDVEAQDYPAKQFADIFAARILSNSVRGKKDSLGTEFQRRDLDAMSQKLMDNDHFTSFINDTYLGDEDEGNSKLRDAEKELYSSRTHGGFIEDEFKKYLLKRPAGELVNSPELARFMPTAKERIEELKKQVKSDPDDRELQAAAAAEIIAIRNACKVERKTGYGLDRQIPTAPEGRRLEDEVKKLARDRDCGDILRDDETRKGLLSIGHGGQMTVNVRKRYENEVQPERRSPAAEAILKKNTIGGRMTELRTEAQEIGRQLASSNAKIRNSAMEKSREVLGEYIALVDKGRNGTGADAPWEYVNALKKSAMKDPSAQKMMNTPEKASGMMNAIASGSVGAFQSKLKQGLDAVKAEAVAPKVPVKQQPGRIMEEPRGPQGPGL